MKPEAVAEAKEAAKALLESRNERRSLAFSSVVVPADAAWRFVKWLCLATPLWDTMDWNPKTCGATRQAEIKKERSIMVTTGRLMIRW